MPTASPISRGAAWRSGSTSAATRPWVRVVIEKPFGHDLESARALNRAVRKAFSEHQVYRIDHYLGKETVQNLMVFRFANSIFEPVWNRHHIHHVQITAAETVGVEHRAGYYEEAGVVRDMFQNHLLQLLSLTAMEPPVAFQADAVRDEKVKVLRAIRRFTAAEIHDYAVRGQYGPGTINGAAVPGYREEPGVDPGSDTPTWAALRLLVDNWRWQGVPFFLRSGKRMARRVSEIAIQFREPPHLMFPLEHGQTIAPNVIAIRVQPNEGISLRVRHQGARRRRPDDRGPDGLQLRRGVRRGGPLGVRDAAARLHGGRRYAVHPGRRGGGRVGSGGSGDRGLARRRTPSTSPTMRREPGGRRSRMSSSRATAPAGDGRDLVTLSEVKGTMFDMVPFTPFRVTGSLPPQPFEPVLRHDQLALLARLSSRTIRNRLSSGLSENDGIGPGGRSATPEKSVRCFPTERVAPVWTSADTISPLPLR